MTQSELIDVLGPGEDDALLLAASWEERCLGLTRRMHGYKAGRILITEYDGVSERRRQHLIELRDRLEPIGSVTVLPATKSDPLENVRRTIAELTLLKRESLRLSIDLTTFTRKHALQLLHGLDSSGLLSSCRFFHTESEDYDTRDDEPVSKGVTHVRAVETFAGRNTPSRDSILVLFLGYEGRRALALWEHLEPNVTLVVIPDPPYREEWRGRTEALNQYLLSCIPEDRVMAVPAMEPGGTEALLSKLVISDAYPLSRYNYRIAPVGPKPQTLGVFRFWRKHPGAVTIVYAAPTRYREEHPSFPPGPTWQVDDSASWD